MEAHQPRVFDFPKRTFGKKVVVYRSFQPSWFDKCPWLDYTENEDDALCFTCAQANQQKMLQWSSNSDLAFISKRFTNWKDATVKFGIHASSKCHKEAVLKMVTLPSSTKNVAESLSAQLKRENLERRQCFLKVLLNIRFLARQGLPLRGHGGHESDSNFVQLMKLRGEDDSRMTGWLEKKTNKYTAPNMKNEMVKTMALLVLLQVLESICSAPFLTIMVDETTDVPNKEQVVVCFRWVDNTLESHEEFIGTYEVGSTQASSLVATIHDLQRMNVSICKLRGQCYDGASSMSGSLGGVSTQLQKEEPRAVYTHCYGHALNIACSDTVKNCKIMRDALDTSYELIKLVKKSPRRDVVTLQKLKEQMPEDYSVLCPTRWTVRAQALQSIIANYKVLQILWEESLDFVKDTEMRSRTQGISARMTSFDFFFGVSLGELLLKHSDNLSKTLQASSMSAAEGQKIADMTVHTLQSIRSDENFLLFWRRIKEKASNLEVDDPVLHFPPLLCFS